MSTDRQKRALHLRRIREDPATTAAVILGVAAAAGAVALVFVFVVVILGSW